MYGHFHEKKYNMEILNWSILCMRNFGIKIKMYSKSVVAIWLRCSPNDLQWKSVFPDI